MSKETDLIAAATKLSTASDALSVKVDALVAAAEKAVAVLKSGDLTPEGEAALAALTTAAANAASAGDRVDAEVLNTRFQDYFCFKRPRSPDWQATRLFYAGYSVAVFDLGACALR